MRLCEDCYQKVKQYWWVGVEGLRLETTQYCYVCHNTKTGCRDFSPEDINIAELFDDLIEAKKK